MKSKIIIVNEGDEQIGLKERGSLDLADIYRVSALIIFDKEGRFLMAQRSLSKKNNPGVWNTSVAGTNDEGETYLSNILKEASEELGVKIKEEDIIEIRKTRNSNLHNYYCTRYSVTLDMKIEDYILQVDEVAAIKFFSLSELEEKISKNPKNYSESFYNFMKRYLQDVK